MCKEVREICLEMEDQSKYKSVEELNKMTVKEVVDYIRNLEENDEGAINNYPGFQNWCFEITEMKHFTKVADELCWEYDPEDFEEVEEVEENEDEVKETITCIEDTVILGEKQILKKINTFKNVKEG